MGSYRVVDERDELTGPAPDRDEDRDTRPATGPAQSDVREAAPPCGRPRRVRESWRS